MQETVGIIGGGAIACGLAATAARHGEVVLWARTPDKAQAGVEKWCSKLDEVDASQVKVVTDIEALAGASVIVEAIAEDLDVKSKLYESLPATNGTILASTTSSLSVQELAARSGRPDRFVGLHVFNPVPKMKLVELVFPKEAPEDVKERARTFVTDLGKVPVEVPDVPGFVVNRLLFPYLFSAVRLMEETGMPAADIDQCMTLGAGHPMGPLALLDMVGLDVSLAIGEEIGADIPDTVRKLVDEGALGRKSGRGLTL